MTEDLLKQKVQRWIVFFSLLILCGKFAAYYLTNSVGIFTDAMESIVNVVAGFISLYSLYWAAKPKDKKHPFGHGKVELVSASVEGLLIVIAGGLIIFEGIKRLYTPSDIEKLDVGIIVVAIAGVMNYIMGWYSIRMGKRYDSIALVAGGRHLQSDTYSTIGLVAGLLLLYFTKLSWIDSALALIFGSIIVATGISILRKTVANLMDKADDTLLQEMVSSISAHRQNDWIDIHNTKIIKYGSYIFVDCDLTLPWYYNIRESHDSCDALKESLESSFSDRAQVSIHSDPCREEHCKSCLMAACPKRCHPFISQNEITLAEITQSDEERNENLEATEK